MTETQRYGLKKFGGALGGDLSADGYQFSTRDRDVIDALLAALEGHRHLSSDPDRLADPASAPSVALVSDVPARQTTHAYSLGDQIHPDPANGHIYRAIQAGTSAGGAVGWTTSSGDQITDGTVIWQEVGALPTTGDLPAGITFGYRVSYLDTYGLETAASDEATVTTPDPIQDPDPPAATAYGGEAFEDGLYYYAITFTEGVDPSIQETAVSQATQVTLGSGANQVELLLPPLPERASGYRIYRMIPGEADLSLIATIAPWQPNTTYTVGDVVVPTSPNDHIYRVSAITSSGSTGGSEPTWPTDAGDTVVNNQVTFTAVAGFIDDGLASSTINAPYDNTTGATAAVVITPPLVDGALPTGVTAWRIYRGDPDYGDQSLVHQVVETVTEDGSDLVTSWIDDGDVLTDGTPPEVSAAFTPPGPAEARAVHYEGADLPTEGSYNVGDQFHRTSDHTLWLRSGSDWYQVQAAGVATGTSLPGSGAEGQLYFRTGDATLWLWRTATGWVQVEDPTITNASSLPGGSQTAGSIFCRTTDNTIWAYLSGAWRPIATGAIVLATGFPGSPAEGTTFFRSTDNTMWVYASSDWREVGATGGATGHYVGTDLPDPTGLDDGVQFFDTGTLTLHVLVSGVWQLVGGADVLDDLADVSAASPDDGDVLTFDDDLGAWTAKPPVHPARTVATYTTASLDQDDDETGTITMALSWRLLRVETDYPARVRLYSTAAKRDADRARAAGIDPTGDHGVMAEVVTDGGMLSLDMSPQADGSNLEGSPTADIPITVANLDTVSRAVTVTCTYLPTE